MKYLKNIVAVLILVGIFQLSYSAELSVDEIQVLDANTLSITLSENPNLDIGELEAEIRVLNDVKMRGAFFSEVDSNSVEILLENPLLPNTTYSLLTVLGADGSIDFTTPGDVEGFIASNISSVEMQDIDSIEIIDDRTIMVDYRNPLMDESIEYKLLAESDVVSIEKPDFYTPEIIISIEPAFTSENDYILMFIEMRDASGAFLEFDTGIYDFKSPIIDEFTLLEDSQEDTLNIEGQELQVESIDTPINPVDDAREGIEGEIDLQAAGEEIDTEQAAGMATHTPDTGAATWVLVLATIVINSFYYLSRRKKQTISA